MAADSTFLRTIRETPVTTLKALPPETHLTLSRPRPAPSRRPHAIAWLGVVAGGIAWVALVAWALDFSFFRAEDDFEAGFGAIAVVAGDLNADGVVDLVVANNDEDTVSVHFGRDGLSFDDAVFYDVGAGPVAVALADINGDGRPDIVTADEVDDTITILLNQGNGNFNRLAPVATGLGPVAIAIVDFDGDGILDVATADNLDETVTLQFGVGDGTFINRQTVLVPGEPMGLLAADLDGSGTVDLVVVNATGGVDESGSIRILQGRGGGVFEGLPEIESETFFFPVDAAIADLNDDGILDIVVVNDEGDSVAVLIGAGGFTFAEGADYSVGSFPGAVVAADFNLDGVLDVATTNFFDDNVRILAGLGDGTLDEGLPVEVGSGPRGMVAADIDGDGRVDLVVANNDDGTFSYLVNMVGRDPFPTPTPGDPSSTPTAPPATPTPGRTCVGDCSGDGDVTVDEILTMVNVALGTGSVAACAAGDANGDGDITVDEILTAVNNALIGCG